MAGKLRVLVRDLQPLVLKGLMAGCSDCLDMWIADGKKNLLEDVRDNQAVAVISNRDYIAEVAGYLPDFLIGIGISSDSDDVVVCKGEKIIHLDNPPPKYLCAVISGLIDEHAS